jgi:hypothetical protein
VGEQQRLGEALFAAFGDHRQGDAGQALGQGQQRALEGEWHQGGVPRGQAQAELLGDLVAEAGCAHARDGQPASGDHQ